VRGMLHVLRRISGPGHFRSRDKDSVHAIRSAIAKPHHTCKLYNFICYNSTGVIANDDDDVQ